MSKFQNAIKVIALVSLLSATAGVAHAQSKEETVGAILGGTIGAVIGGEIDNKGSSTDGKIIGGLVGGSLGYVIGGDLENDRDIRRRYEGRAGEFYRYDGKAYRRYRDADYGYVSFRIGSGDPYYYSDGRKKAHPVFAEHPGRGNGKGLKKNRR